MLHFLVRLACVRHAASVDSEPGSNSRLKPVHSPDGSSANLTDTLTPQPFSLRTKAPVDIPTIIGELPSRLIRRRPAYAKPHVRNSPDGPDSCEITRAITLVLSHDWHVQPFCQRPDSTPPERRFSGTPGHKPGAPRNLLSALGSGRHAAKPSTDEPFKLTPSGCFLSMWISLEIRGESLLSRLSSLNPNHSLIRILRSSDPPTLMWHSRPRLCFWLALGLRLSTRSIIPDCAQCSSRLCFY